MQPSAATEIGRGGQPQNLRGAEGSDYGWPRLDLSPCTSDRVDGRRFRLTQADTQPPTP